MSWVREVAGPLTTAQMIESIVWVAGGYLLFGPPGLPLAVAGALVVGLLRIIAARLRRRADLRCHRVPMLIRGVDDNGDPIDVPVQTCPSCGALVNVAEFSLDEHAAELHPVLVHRLTRHAGPGNLVEPIID